MSNIPSAFSYRTGSSRRQRRIRSRRARRIIASPPRVHPTIMPIFDDKVCGVGVGEDVVNVEDELPVEEEPALMDEDAL